MPTSRPLPSRPATPHAPGARAGRLRALIFDVDGTLADTERRGHLAACNAAFDELGLPIRWSWEEYRALLRIPGNERRMHLALAALGTMSDEEVARTAAELFRRKQAWYVRLVDRLPLRPGVEAILRAATERGVRLAIVSTSSEPQIRALLAARLPAFARLFDPLLGQQSGPKVGDGGALYERCLRELAVPVERVIAVEDAEDGFRAARRASLRCVVVPNDYAPGGDFTDAALVVSSLASVKIDDLERLCPPLPASETA